jgi:prepilin-type N-terminal cleavage/methylation domain-containing protein
MTKTDKTNSGFTLIELSIVLVIIGLIIGGVMVGRDLIRTAELRKLYSQEQQIISSVNTFRVKYKCLPGDCTNATDYFGTDPQGCVAYMADKTPKVPTCNGNGNEIYDIAPTAIETLTFWQHLSDAGLWPGLFRGGPLSSNNADQTLYPPVSINTSFFWAPSNDPGDMELGNPYSTNIIYYSNYAGNVNGLLTPAESFAFDSKYDDGNPASGSIQAMSGAYIVNCTNQDAGFPINSYSYDLTQTGQNCNLVFNHPGF